MPAILRQSDVGRQLTPNIELRVARLQEPIMRHLGPVHSRQGPLSVSTATGGNSDPGKRQCFGP